MRERKLGFAMFLVSILRKRVKALQNGLNELSLAMNLPLLTARGYSQGRQQRRHTAFIELNRALIVPFSRAHTPKTDQGLRILACDGSKIRLPTHPTIAEHCGAIASVTGAAPCGIAYGMPDGLNKIGLDGQLAAAAAYEVDLALAALEQTTAHDWLLYERTFAAYRLLATLVRCQRHFVMRCSAGCFAVAQALFAADQETRQRATLCVPAAQKKRSRQAGLPLSSGVRFVAGRLSTGGLAVLVTSLLEQADWPAAAFKPIYNLRWGVETRFDLIKNRLSLENFSGKTVQAVRQDF